MFCEKCQTKEAMVHISTVVHAEPSPHEEHLCLECSELFQATDSLLNPQPAPLPPFAARLVTSLSEEAQAKVQTVNDALMQLDPTLESFCKRRNYDFHRSSKLWPSRSACARGVVDRYMHLTPDTTFVEILKRGFWPEMPWSLYASAYSRMVPGRPFRVLTMDLLRNLPFSDLASVLEPRLEEGYLRLDELTPQDVLTRGEMPRGRSRAFPGYSC